MRRYVKIAGEMAIDFHGVVAQGLEFKTVEVDEFYGFIAAKRHNVEKMKVKVEGAGEAVHFMSVVPKTALHLELPRRAKHDRAHTTQFIRDLGMRLKRNSEGDFVLKSTIISDGYCNYKSAIQDEWACV